MARRGETLTLGHEQFTVMVEAQPTKRAIREVTISGKNAQGVQKTYTIPESIWEAAHQQRAQQPLLLGPKQEEPSVETLQKFMLWCDERREQHPSDEAPIGGRFSLVLTQTGIGVAVKAVDQLDGTEADLTDYDKW